MPIENSVFIGSEDMDSPFTNIQRGFHRVARNMVFRGPQGNMRGESVPGTTQIFNPFIPNFPNTGLNKTVGNFYDAVYKRVFWFNYNSTGQSGIYIYNTQTAIWQSLLVNGSATDGDILGFLPQQITSICINYRESVDGNLLFYIDSLGRPTCLNIDRYLNNPYPVTKRAFIDLAKAPPVMPPRCTYENDPGATINNLKNALFQFRCRYICDDFQKTVVGTGSEVPLPPLFFDQPTDADPAKGSRIAVYVPTGDIDIKKIEIWGTQYSDATAPVGPQDNLNVIGNYFLVATLDKDELSIPSNDVYRFVFRNDGVYAPGDPTETNLPFDWVPQTANAMDLLNGSVPILGGITEGYDPVPLNMTASVVTRTSPPYSPIAGILFFAYAGSSDSGGTGTTLNIVLTGAGNGTTYPTSLPPINGALYVRANDTSTGSDISFSTTSGGGIVLVAAVLTALGAAAAGQGWTVVSIVNNVLTLSYNAGFILNASLIATTTIFSGNDFSFAYPDGSAEQFAIQYYDNKGRTNGATLSPGGILKTTVDDSGLTIPIIEISISSRPPIWAYYYDIVRAAALTYNKRLFWISNATYTQVDLNTNVKYAYIDISLMKDYNRNIEASTPVVSYEFTPGDRVQFQGKYLFDGTQSIFSTPIDLEIVALSPSVIINGVVVSGNFLKVVYPNGLITATFDFGGDNFQWYKILIYNYVKRFENKSTQLFYEFGQRFGIGNPGTNSAYHLGIQQSQDSTLLNPALIEMAAGDLFYRFRNVPVGIINNPTTGTMSYADRYASVPVAIQGGSIVNARYELRDTILISSNSDNYNFGTTNYLFWNKLATPVTIRIEGEYSASVDNAITHGLFLKRADSSFNNTIVNLVNNFAMPLTANQNKSYDVTFDQYVEIGPNTKVFFESINQSISGVSHLNINTFTTFRFSIISNFVIPIIESSASDKYNIVCNSDSRPTVFDPNAKQQYLPTGMRWGLADQLNTNINQTNRFYFQNFDEIDKSHGDIRRLKARQRELRIYQDRRTGRTGIYSRFLKQNDGTDVVATTNEIISRNNVEYYDGDFGISNQPASLASSGYVDYFTDPVRGSVIRISQNGATEISRLYKVQTWAGSALPPYLNSHPYPYGGNAEILGVCYFVSDRDSEIIFVTQGSTDGLPAQSHSFDEKRNAWTSFYDFAPDSIVCAENQLFSFSNGIMYQHNNTTTYCNFYGQQFKPSITIVKNDASLLKKRWISMTQIANAPWASPDLFTQNVNFGQTQQSNLIDSDFADLEGEFSAQFLNDINSPGGIANGDELKGTYLVARLEPDNGAIFNYLALAAVKFNQSEIVER